MKYQRGERRRSSVMDVDRVEEHSVSFLAAFALPVTPGLENIPTKNGSVVLEGFFNLQS